MKTAICTFINKYTLLNQGDAVVVGLSGGPDSVYLLDLLDSLKSTYNLTLIAAHLNHGWRSDAQDDLLFCQNLCEQRSITFESAHATELPLTIDKKKSLEEQGRLLRRYYFNSLRQKYNASSVALGHHQDDQIETFFIRLIRGSSIDGLGAMRPKKDFYIRPLLETSKKEILDYLNENHIPFRTDSTNESSDFLRNRLRMIMPLLQNCDQRFTDGTLKAVKNMQETYDNVQVLIKEKCATVTFLKENHRIMNLNLLCHESLFVQEHIVQQWLMYEKAPCTLTHSFITEIIRFLTSDRGGKHTISQSWSIVKKKHEAYIEKL